MLIDRLATLNVSLLIPVLSLFVLQRLRGVLSVPLTYLSGLRCCLPQRSTLTGFDWTRLTDSAPQEPKLKSLGLCLLTLNSTFFKRFTVTNQLLYANYEMLLELGVWAVLVYLVTSLYNCASSGGVYSSLHTMYSFLPAMVALLYAVRVPLQVAYLTGWRAVETKIAVVVGCATFVTTIALLFLEVDPLMLGFSSIAHDEGLHLKALSLTVLRKPMTVSAGAWAAVTQVVIAILLALVVAGMALPALRFSQTFLSIIVSPTTRASTKALTVLELLFPAVLIVALSGWVGAVASEDASLIKVGLTALYVIIKLANSRAHLQAFLDTAAHSALLLPLNFPVEDRPKLAKTVEARSDYLVAAAAQLLALPVFLTSACVLYLRHSNVGGAQCVAARQWFGLPTEPYASLYSSLVNLDATSETARLAAQEPFWSDVWGVMLHTHKRGGEITFGFFIKLSTLHLLPPHTAQQLALALMGAAAAAWLALSLSAVAYWFLAPKLLLASGQLQMQERHPAKPIPGKSAQQLAAESASRASVKKNS